MDTELLSTDKEVIKAYLNFRSDNLNDIYPDSKFCSEYGISIKRLDDLKASSGIEFKTMQALKEVLKDKALDPDQIRALLNERYAYIYDLATNPNVNKKNIDLDVAKNILDGLAKLNIKEMNQPGTIVVQSMIPRP